MITAVRVAMPDVYDFVDRHIHHFSLGLSTDQQGSSDSEEKTRLVDQGLKKLLSGHEDKQVSNSVRHLVDAISQRAAGVHPKKDKPQGFRSPGPRDYWRRYSALAPIPEDEKDQVLLRVINDWKKGTSTQLVDWLTDPKHRHPVGAFPAMFTFQDVEKLLTQACDSLGRTSAAEWGRELEAPGMSTLRRLIDSTMVDEQDRLEALLTSLLNRWAPEHLPLSYSLADDSGRRTPAGQSSPLDDTGVSRVAEVLSHCLLTSFNHDSSLLIAALQDSSVPVVSRIFELAIEANPCIDGPEQFEGWDEFANTLLSAASVDRARVLPEIRALITRPESNGLGGRRDVIDEEVASRLFDIERLRQILGDEVGGRPS